ncbi:hypothetical protein BDW68DRAFT_168930 [Aspergillus falconensis]
MELKKRECVVIKKGKERHSCVCAISAWLASCTDLSISRVILFRKGFVSEGIRLVQGVRVNLTEGL